MSTAYCPICDRVVPVRLVDFYTRMCPSGHLVNAEAPAPDPPDEPAEVEDGEEL
jgi:hypothetical protein